MENINTPIIKEKEMNALISLIVLLILTLLGIVIGSLFGGAVAYTIYYSLSIFLDINPQFLRDILGVCQVLGMIGGFVGGGGSVLNDIFENDREYWEIVKNWKFLNNIRSWIRPNEID